MKNTDAEEEYRMKKAMLRGALAALCALMWICGCAGAEDPARAYAAWIEEMLPDAAFEDAPVPDFCAQALGADYVLVGRSDARYGSYVACARRSDAPALPETATVERGGAFSEKGYTRRWTLKDGEQVLYDFVLADGVELTAFDGGARLIVTFDEGAAQPCATSDSHILEAASPEGRARMAYRRAHGFVEEDKGRPQLALMVHDVESWRAGATDQPTTFYLDVDVPQDLTRSRTLSGAEAERYGRVPIGAYLCEGESRRELAVSGAGVKGVVSYDPLRIAEAGPGYDALLNRAEAALGYRPGEMDFLGKRSVRATLEWQAGWTRTEEGIARWAADSQVLEDAEGLRRLDALLNGADFTLGSVNCPSPAFLTLEYDDGSYASLAVAINSFSLFFYRGVCFETEEDIIDLMQLRDTDFFRGYYGG